MKNYKKKQVIIRKSPTYQSDINEIEYHINGCDLMPFKSFFKFSLLTEILDLSCWKFKYDIIEEKKLSHVKFLCHTHILLIENLLFYMIRIIIIRFNDTHRFIISNFYHERFNSFMNYHRDFNTIFTFDWVKNYQWFGTSRLLTYYTINETVINEKN